MKQYLLPLNIILLIAVAVLFYLHFASNKPAAQVAGKSTQTAAPGSFKMAYFEMDSIDANYEHLKDVRNELKTKQNQLAGQLNSLKNRYMEKVNKYKQEAPTMTQDRATMVEQELMNDQKVMASKEQELDMEMQETHFKKMQGVNKKIEEYLKEYNKDKGYSYIIANQQGSIYYIDPAYNITDELLKGLNEEYKKKDK